MVVRLHIYSKGEKIISSSEGSGHDHNPTPLAERARIAHHSETNPNFIRIDESKFIRLFFYILE